MENKTRIYCVPTRNALKLHRRVDWISYENMRRSKHVVESNWVIFYSDLARRTYISKFKNSNR